jgi:hypothetical protein
VVFVADDEARRGTLSGRRGAWVAIGLVCLAGLAAAGIAVTRNRARTAAETRTKVLTREVQYRQRLFAEIQPVTLANCKLERFGETHDCGYLLCGNLLGDVKSAYSYGITGYDPWGCDVSTRLGVQVHQYDCFNLTRPRCPRGKTVFHEECIGAGQRTEDGRPFDTLENQVRKNGDAGKQLVVKMDVEGAEWESFLGLADDQLRRIDQLAVEFHGIDEGRFIAAMSKLKESFYIANLHWNNFGCDSAHAPFSSWAYEVLLVSKRIGVPDPGKPVVRSALDRPNNPALPDCQASP